MTARQTRVLTVLTALVFVGLAVIFTTGCAQEAVIPQDVTPRHKEVRPLYTSCVHASIAGVPLPLIPGDPGWNPRLDHDGDRKAC